MFSNGSRGLRFLGVSLFSIGLSACGGGGGGEANVTVALNNLAVSAQVMLQQSHWNRSASTLIAGPRALAGTPADPTGFSIRIKSIYLVEDQDCGDCTIPLGNNIGEAAFLWTNPDCPKGSDDADCSSLSYFDLNRASAAVNADLNAQSASVPAGTYKYIKFGLLGEQSGGNNTYNNTKWSYSSAGVVDAEFASIQTEWAAAFTEPLVVADGDVIALTVGYDLNDSVDTNTDANEKVAGAGTHQPGAADDCVTISSTKVCLFFPEISVTAAKQ